MRRQIQFWLNTDKRDERLLWQTICEWKARREFASKVREGLKLVYELSRGTSPTCLQPIPVSRKRY